MAIRLFALLLRARKIFENICVFDDFDLSETADIVSFYQPVKLSATSEIKAMPISDASRAKPLVRREKTIGNNKHTAATAGRENR
ncbi:hypothetical protein N7E02_08310 [Aliirhizobium terrae]|uniref:hypothetical protein n=1 Tax=Terrirhizobium terrae TaxID=2926709 RepID=UPI0025791C49|nr:hypothetical protein [Rhizobium sp. CC-CFT758]WJH40606.1 hypothetical protein N7E02_08310 [Rhizobium sp. CC-CFT758]